MLYTSLNAIRFKNIDIKQHVFEFIVIPNTFLKYVFLKDEKSILVYHSKINNKIYLVIFVMEFIFNGFETLNQVLVPSQNKDILYYYLCIQQLK